MSKKGKNKNENASFTKPTLTEPVLTKAPDYSNPEPAPEYKYNKPAVSFEKPKKPTVSTKIPRVVEKIPESSGSVVSFTSKSAPTKVEMGSVPDRVARFNRMALGMKWTSRSALEGIAREILGGDIVSLKGAGDREVAFEVEGVRVPAEGYYFIR